MPSSGAPIKAELDPSRKNLAVVAMRTDGARLRNGEVCSHVSSNACCTDHASGSLLSLKLVSIASRGRLLSFRDISCG